MQINVTKCSIGLVAIVSISCTPVVQDNDLYGAGFVELDEATWLEKNTQPYPFTVISGEISCGFHPEFGREVYFEPKGFTDESYIGTPLNKAAIESLKQANMIPNVPYSIKEGADLSEAVQIGLRVCDEQKNSLANS